MPRDTAESRVDYIARSAEDFFGQELDDISAPGGESRSSFRLHFPDRTVIATLRPNFRRTHLEGYVLGQLSEHCDDVPRALGVVEEILFQEDVGGRRLNVAIAEVEGIEQHEMAHAAVSSIFRFQSAARKTDLAEMLPHLGDNAEWYENFIGAVDALEPYGGGIPDSFDPYAVLDALDVPKTQFIKWDCRSGNAALGDDGRLRWFDFEYSGIRHGAEDFAWLIGDEAWPMDPSDMVDIVIDAFDPECGHTMDAYFEYLSHYTVFHCIQRFKLIVKEAEKRGWQKKEKVRKYDDAGIHPDFAAHICKVGGYFAAQYPLTSCLRDHFEAAEKNFRTLSERDARREDKRMKKLKRRRVLRA
ncbi:hypothetical protein DU478_06240 [Thalassococcus profundi]|uniref:Aminoglycoside phosphotransferase domain-containing protein n=1 Tax=Thalassococcus profundi TaxID=2282382 RepID=A0A369TSA5_9RHOB|nr:hypothetical protein [Thalassococcus profundi]RDD67325.1 hypothetical protein DU478_06240 [Thalassococcus profundi]